MKRRSPSTRLVSAGVTALLATALLAASAEAGPTASPRFATTYVGTATGTLRMPGGRVDTWKVSNLTFHLQDARLARGRWGGTYLVTGGTVTYSSKSTGACTFTKNGTLSLGKLSWMDGAISFLQNRSGAGGYTYQARAARPLEVSVTQVCGSGDGAAQSSTTVSPGGGLWLLTDIGEHLVPGKRLNGTRTESSARGTRTWTWNLAARA